MPLDFVCVSRLQQIHSTCAVAAIAEPRITTQAVNETRLDPCCYQLWFFVVASPRSQEYSDTSGPLAELSAAGATSGTVMRVVV